MTQAPVPTRHQLRWVNGIGFALTIFFFLWLLAFVVALAESRSGTAAIALPKAYVVVGAVSLLASAVFLGVVLFGYVLRGGDVGQPLPRYLLYAWTCAGGLFFLSQTIALAKFGAVEFAGVPPWLSTLFWYFMPIGAVTFGLLLWVNAEAHHYPWEDAEPEEAWEGD